MIKYYKHTDEKDKLDTGTLPDGPLSRDDIPSSSINIGITNTRVPSATESIKRKEITRVIYFAYTSTKIFIGFVGSYPFRHTAGLLICQYFTC